jgi:hypothetical protein
VIIDVIHSKEKLGSKVIKTQVNLIMILFLKTRQKKMFDQHVHIRVNIIVIELMEMIKLM